MLFSKTVCEKAIVEESDRAFYAIQYNSKAIQLDVEIVSSLILQYCYYLCLRSESSIYDVFPMELPSLLSKPHFMTIAVQIIEIFNFIDSFILYKITYSWIRSCLISS